MKQYVNFFLIPFIGALLFGGTLGFASFSIKGDVLYLQPQENGLAYGIVAKGDGPLAAPISVLGACFESEVKSPKFKYDVGSRLGLGYQMCCSPVVVFLDWMQLNSTARGSVHLSREKSGEYFVGTWSRPVLPVLTPFLFAIPQNALDIKSEQKAAAKLHLDFDTVDIGFSVPMYPSTCLRLIPQLGIRVALIDQTYKIFDTFDGFIVGQGTASFFEKIKFKNDFFGAGLMGGLETEYDLRCQLRLFGKFQGALLRSNTDVKGRYFAKTEIDFGDWEREKISACQEDSVCRLQPILDLALGIRWLGSLCQGCYPLTLQLSFEQHSYFGQNQLQDLAYIFNEPEFVVAQSNRGDLTLQGWSFSAKIEF